MKSRNIGGVSVSIENPPKRKQLTEMIQRITRKDDEEVKKIIDGSKLYASVPKPTAKDAEPKQSDKDSK